MFNFAETHSGENVREFLGRDSDHSWKGRLVTDEFSDYKVTFERGVTEVGSVAHARRKFQERWSTCGPWRSLLWLRNPAAGGAVSTSRSSD